MALHIWITLTGPLHRPRSRPLNSVLLSISESDKRAKFDAAVVFELRSALTAHALQGEWLAVLYATKMNAKTASTSGIRYNYSSERVGDSGQMVREEAVL